jgi:hypothetical protein
MTTRTIKTFGVTRSEAENCLIKINIGDDTVVVVEFQREPDGSLYLSAWETANPDSNGAVENHYPEFYDEVSA